MDEHGAKVLASVPQGRNLRDNVNKLAGNPGGPALNKGFKGEVIQTKNGSSIDEKRAWSSPSGRPHEGRARRHCRT